MSVRYIYHNSGDGVRDFTDNVMTMLTKVFIPSLTQFTDVPSYYESYFRAVFSWRNGSVIGKTSVGEIACC